MMYKQTSDEDGWKVNKEKKKEEKKMLKMKS